jgi:hypothetical protein
MYFCGGKFSMRNVITEADLTISIVPVDSQLGTQVPAKLPPHISSGESA